MAFEGRLSVPALKTKKAVGVPAPAAKANKRFQRKYTTIQSELQAIEDDEDVDGVGRDGFRCASPYYHDPAYPEFDGWRELLR